MLAVNHFCRNSLVLFISRLNTFVFTQSSFLEPNVKLKHFDTFDEYVQMYSRKSRNMWKHARFSQNTTGNYVNLLTWVSFLSVCYVKIVNIPSSKPLIESLVSKTFEKYIFIFPSNNMSSSQIIYNVMPNRLRLQTACGCYITIKKITHHGDWAWGLYGQQPFRVHPLSYIASDQQSSFTVWRNV